ncbi:MAG: hypothetical protein GX422_03335 [Deltaproteobacteria bacterium]|nr:hypothetical protein [Deltaproteobacteria bacterium]
MAREHGLRAAGFAGCWSHRIDPEHRLVYQIEEDKIRILVYKYHY